MLLILLSLLYTTTQAQACDSTTCLSYLNPTQCSARACNDDSCYYGPCTNLRVYRRQTAQNSSTTNVGAYSSISTILCPANLKCTDPAANTPTVCCNWSELCNSSLVAANAQLQADLNDPQISEGSLQVFQIAFMNTSTNAKWNVPSKNDLKYPGLSITYAELVRRKFSALFQNICLPYKASGSLLGQVNRVVEAVTFN